MSPELRGIAGNSPEINIVSPEPCLGTAELYHEFPHFQEKVEYFLLAPRSALRAGSQSAAVAWREMSMVSRNCR